MEVDGLRREQAQDAANPYDLVPYESQPFSRTHIRRLHALGRLFGLTPADVDSCRVLELGGASGGNLLPMAIDHPESAFIGIDRSARQIETGRRAVAELGVKNLDLRAMSIMDVDAGFGQFDYIIAHGVFSWVPAEVQDKLLAICRENLRPGGIAIVSYNTLPGWSAWRNLREAILYDCEGCSSLLERVRCARRLLHVLRDSGRSDTRPYWESLRREIDRMLELSDWYLLHDHLEDDNTAFYFHEFIERATAAGLQFIGESDLSAMDAGAIPPAAMEALSLGGDTIRRLQYLDFLQNRRFRLTLLSHDAVEPDHSLEPDRLWRFRWSSALRPRNAASAPEEPIELLGPAGEVQLRTGDRLSGAAFLSLCRARLPAEPDEIVREAMRRFGIADEGGLRRALLSRAPGLVMSGAIELHSCEPSWVPEVSERPLASRLARYQARQSSWVTNQRHEPIGIDPAVREVLRRVDGRHSRTALVEAMRDLAGRGKLQLQQHGRPVMDRMAAARLVPALVDEVLSFLAANALLIA